MLYFIFSNKRKGKISWKIHLKHSEKESPLLTSESPYDLIDGAAGSGLELSAEFEFQRSIIRDAI